ncbi:MAG: SDR family oxidoreductase [Alphaproteobacteria bacterium]|nr:SDR family oxidoreductase [Alphaproteobacteria bacterium]MCB9930533.1 SDR family oxidoreductase [Alphaproteobacteria bacterium]
MSESLAGRVAIVTGAQQGIGAAIARAFGRAGAKLVVNWLDDRAGAEAVAADVRAAGSEAVLVQGSVTDRAAIDALLEAAETLGGVSILVNNAAVFPRTPFLDLTEADWDGVLNVNLRGGFVMAQAAARRMVAAGRPGAIVNLSSGAAYRGSPRGTHYVASKAGVLGLTRGMAQELAEHRIRVNAIAPGLTDTAQPRFGMTEVEIAAKGASMPLGLVEAADIADAAVFLASDAARRITGQVLHVNSGDYLG